jgi:hypothetical protein
MSESEFSDLIDCRFPYRDTNGCRELIALGASISPNAAFMVHHEICRPPRSEAVESSVLQGLLSEWVASFNHPLLGLVLPIADEMTRGQQVEVETALRAMREVAMYRGLFAALAILSMCCDDADDKVNDLYHEIVHAWEASR